MIAIAITIVLLWSTQTMGVHAAACNATVLASIARDANLLGCISTSGVSLASIADTPNAEQLQGLCHSDSCLAFVRDLKELDLNPCTAFDGQLIDLATNFVEPVLSACTTMGVVIDNANIDGSTAAGSRANNLRGSSFGSASENKDAATVGNTGISVAVSEVPTPTPTAPTSSATSSLSGFTVQVVAFLILLGAIT